MRDSVDSIADAWQHERPDVDNSSIGVVTRIWRLAQLLEQERAQILEAVGADESTLDALATLRRAGHPYRLTAGELQRRSLVTAGAVSQRLDKLERAGLIRRTRDRRDRRIVHVILTPKGRHHVDAIFTAIMRQEQELLEPLTTRQRQTLVTTLRQWLHWFEHSDSSSTTTA